MSALHRTAICILIMTLLLSGGCSHTDEISRTRYQRLASMGYTIQAGAFENVNKAARLTALLEQRGINAYYFRHPQGLYKVRFGNFSTYELARQEAERLKSASLIDCYYIVRPQDSALAISQKKGSKYLRNELVKTARTFIGVPYRWGGTDPVNGFDCSGLVQAVYQMNGLDLPRVSRDQFRAGNSIHKRQLEKGDLVFFATSGGRRVSHVGIYVGGGKFIHAPGRGQKIRTNSLKDNYYKKHYAGARTYI